MIHGERGWWGMAKANMRMLLVSEESLKQAIKQHMVTVGDDVYYGEDEDWDLAYEDMIECLLNDKPNSTDKTSGGKSYYGPDVIYE